MWLEGFCSTVRPFQLRDSVKPTFRLLLLLNNCRISISRTSVGLHLLQSFSILAELFMNFATRAATQFVSNHALVPLIQKVQNAAITLQDLVPARPDFVGLSMNPDCFVLAGISRVLQTISSLSGDITALI